LSSKAEGARIFYQSLEDNVSGFLYRDKTQAVIGVNTHHAHVRQNFTTAHELGHLLLHEQEQLHIDHEFRVRLRDDVSSQGTNDDEREANFFAASLLMPKQFLEEDLANEEYVDVLDDDLLSELARKYGVSSQALVNRLKNLNYIPE
jgi:Zn-dependent peptidase ImmA (M78 family)